MKFILLFASIYNIISGLIIILIPEVASMYANFNFSCNLLLRLFSGGTAIVFGAGYFNLFKRPDHDITLLYYGTALKYWVFIICVYCFIFSKLSFQMLLLFGFPNLVFAVLFTMYIIGNSNKPHHQKPNLYQP